ncbi:MAG: hypothetical protein M1828_002042 [Chrysothrix sp. TS-e1954]|nr:MAG: hypothetical protein M1828_002042 [Chrysothrix sp. TS-e1954]
MGIFPWQTGDEAKKDEQEQKPSQATSDEDHSNSFTVVRRFADAQMPSIFSSITSDPIWRNFERSYERATNPERVKTESRGLDDPAAPLSAQPLQQESRLRCPALRYDDEDDKSEQAFYQRMKEERDAARTGQLNIWLAEPWREASSDEATQRPSPEYAPEQLKRDNALGKQVDWHRAFDELETAARKEEEDAARQDPFSFKALQDAFPHPLRDLTTALIEEARQMHGRGAMARQERSEARPTTELDLYEHFLGRDDRSAAQACEQPTPVGEGPNSQPTSTDRTYYHEEHESSHIDETGAHITTVVVRDLHEDNTMTTNTKTYKRLKDGGSESSQVVETRPLRKDTLITKPGERQGPTLQRMIEDKAAHKAQPSQPRRRDQDDTIKKRDPKSNKSVRSKDRQAQKNIKQSSSKSRDDEQPPKKSGWFWSS